MPGRSDLAQRRRCKRAGRERGCWIYIPAEQLEAIGIDPHEPPPWYRTWTGGRRPRVLVNLYREA